MIAKVKRCSFLRHSAEFHDENRRIGDGRFNTVDLPVCDGQIDRRTDRRAEMLMTKRQYRTSTEKRTIRSRSPDGSTRHGRFHVSRPVCALIQKFSNVAHL